MRKFYQILVVVLLALSLVYPIQQTIKKGWHNPCFPPTAHATDKSYSNHPSERRDWPKGTLFLPANESFVQAIQRSERDQGPILITRDEMGTLKLYEMGDDKEHPLIFKYYIVERRTVTRSH